MTQEVARFSLFANKKENFLFTKFVKKGEKTEPVKVQATYSITNQAKTVSGSGLKDGEDKNGNPIRRVSFSIKNAEGKVKWYNGSLFVSPNKEGNQADLFGTAKTQGDNTEYRLSGWLNEYTDKEGNKNPYIAVIMSQPLADENPDYSLPDSDDIPF